MTLLTTRPPGAEQSHSPALRERIGELMTGWVGQLPLPAARAIPRDMVGYVILGLVTFVLDLVLLLALHRFTPLPLGITVLIADGTAWALNFWLNRTLNFRSESPMGPQAARYSLVICGELAISASVTTLLAGIGTPLPVARIAAGACVTCFGYLTCRFWIFRERAQSTR
jgi:putative flippase GtrA